MVRGKERTAQVLEAIQTLTEELGYSPSIREIMDRTGISSSANVLYHLKKLDTRGLIMWQHGKPRTIVIVKPVWYTGRR